MAKQRSLMLKVGLGMAIVGCILVANLFNNESLWAQWVLGFGLFYLGIPIAIVGAAIHFVGNKSGAKDLFSSATGPDGKANPAG